MTVKRMDNVGIVVEDIDAAIEFITELGLELEGRAPVEGGSADGVTGLSDMRVETAMVRYAGRSQPTRAVPHFRAARGRRSSSGSPSGSGSRLPERIPWDVSAESRRTGV